MKTFNLSIFIFLVVFSSRAQDIFFAPSALDGQIIQYDEFVLSYNEEHEQPNWVAYILTESEIYLESRDRPYRFNEDHNVISGSAVHDDYTNTGFDRGHLSRAMYNKISEKAYLESFFMSNVSPQYGINFNRSGGDWYNLEELEISFTKKLNELYCVTGPIFKDNLGSIGSTTTITVPDISIKSF
ncbi:MAG: DNA/RNA non-specific endonuclease [Desulfotignum sp.]|nr:DNA/RNA non-specific endonuclease [Desulfotignum sp.]